jgi:hypothetical protein
MRSPFTSGNTDSPNGIRSVYTCRSRHATGNAMECIYEYLNYEFPVQCLDKVRFLYTSGT